MKIKLVFEDWRNKDHESIYRTEEGINLSLSNFHSGTTFDGEIIVDGYEQDFLRHAMEQGYRPVFYILPEGY